MKRAKIPDPNAIETFQICIPRFAANSTSRLYSELLQLRRDYLCPRLRGVVSEGAGAIGPAAVLTRWRLNDGALLTIACNLGEQSANAELPESEPIWGARPEGGLPPATTIVWIEQP
jgi:maltooligosyltrehalose trehalohydrolase